MRHLFLAAAVVSMAGPAMAERIANPIAVFNGLDKITGVTTTFEIPIGEERRFGNLVVKPQVCYSRPVTEAPKTTSFVQVDEISSGSARRRLFSGWMFAESPGLSGVEHAIYDVWLNGCRDPEAPPPVVEIAPEQPATGTGDEEEVPQD